jgi:putative addiction module killer protein
MFEVEKTDVFLKWLRGLNDVRAVARIQIRIDRLSLGNMGDVKAVGEGISEMRIDYGPGYRVYFK